MSLSKIENWKNIEWTKLGSGSYNQAYISKDKKYVFKIQLNKLPAIDRYPDTPERSIRLWNQINPDLPAFLAVTQYGAGWICPFVEGEQPSDEELSRAVIDIFNKTGRVLTDATARDNFKKTSDGRVVCIDIGMAFQLENNTQSIARVKSDVSNKTWHVISSKYGAFLTQSEKYNPLTVKTLKALLFIEFYYPDVSNVDFFYNSPRLINKLARAYDKHAKVSTALIKIPDQTPKLIETADLPAPVQSVSVSSLSLKQANYKLFKPLTPKLLSSEGTNTTGNVVAVYVV